MSDNCSICGRSYCDTYVFKGGFICEDCIHYIKDTFTSDGSLREGK